MVEKGKMPSQTKRRSSWGGSRQPSRSKRRPRRDFVGRPATGENESSEVKHLGKKLDQPAKKRAFYRATPLPSPSQDCLRHPKARPSSIGMHFMTPVPVMQLVRSSGLTNLSETFETVKSLALKMADSGGSQRFPGLSSNRILMPMINDAVILSRRSGNTRSHRHSHEHWA